MRTRSSKLWPAFGSLAAALGLLLFLALGSGLRPEAASGNELAVAGTPAGTEAPATGTPAPAVAETPAPGTPTPTHTPTPPAPALSASPAATLLPATQGPFSLSSDQAIDLIWKGDYDQAERALQVLLRNEADPSARAEFLVYLAFVASIHNDQEAARTLLREAVENSPGLALSPVEFPKVLRDMLAEIHAQLVEQLPRPQRGSLDSPQHVLAPAATPVAWKGKQKWYRKWYVWAGVAAAVTVAIIVLRGDERPPPTQTGTPTVTPTPTLTPSEFSFTPTPSLKFQPCGGGETVHVFSFPTPLIGHVVVNRAVVGLEIQGDYDGDELLELARLRVETFRDPIIGLNLPGQYCNTARKENNSEEVRGQIQAALQDGQIEILVRDGMGANDHCRVQCSQFHRVFLEINYSIVP